jgi:hypothetical protein
MGVRVPILQIAQQARASARRIYESLVEPVVAASKKTASAAGYLCAGRERAETRIAQGFRFISGLSVSVP